MTKCRLEKDPWFTCACLRAWRRDINTAMLGWRLEPLLSLSSICRMWSLLLRYSFCMLARSPWMSMAMLTTSSLAELQVPGWLTGLPRLRLARLGFELDSEDMAVNVLLEAMSTSVSTGLDLSFFPTVPFDFFFRNLSSFFIADPECSPPSIRLSWSINKPNCPTIDWMISNLPI